jgi:EAL and modified HD-GYP domain-containing signal transduction protein
MQEIYLGRQPIYNHTFQVEGFELFYRHAQVGSAEFIDSDMATSQVVINTLTDIGLANVVGKGKAFINVARSFILAGYLEALIGPQLVFEIVGDIAVDEDLLNALRGLRRRGQRFVLDDYMDNEANQALLEIADYVKIDMLTTPKEEVRRLVSSLRQYKIALMAERIENHEVLEFCQSLKFDYFQGYHFSQPKLLKFQSIPTNRLAVLQLISKLYDPQVGPKSIESLIAQDVSLSYKLLRHINSAYFNLPKRIESIQRAVILLGINNIRTWATLISLANIEDTRSDLITIALVRAKMCELLAVAKGLDLKESSYTVGLLSVLDAMTQNPMEEVLKHLSLSDEINTALLTHEGPLGRILDCVLAYERCDWDSLDTFGLEPNQIGDAYLSALSDAFRASYELL